MSRCNILDNQPAIDLKLKVNGKLHNLSLSSVYGSTNVRVDTDIPRGTPVEIYCPHCSALLDTDELCKECNASLATLELFTGGAIQFCTRRGCTNHNLDIPDVDVLYREYEDAYEQDITYTKRTEIEKVTKYADYEGAVKLREGTFLHFYCPHCYAYLIRNGVVVLNIMDQEGDRGELHLGPRFCEYTHITTLEIIEGWTVSDISCPHCLETLIERDRYCQAHDCGAIMAKMVAVSINQLFPFSICTRKGCTYHTIGKLHNLFEI